MSRSAPTTPTTSTAVPLPWRDVSDSAARTRAGSLAALLRLAEAATLASAAGLRSVLDLRGTSAIGVAPPAVEEGPVVEPAAPELQPQDSAEGAASAEPLVPHWDELNLARIRGRLPRLSLDQVRSLLAYEHAHAGRLPIVAMLENRIRKLEGQPPEAEAASPAD